MTARSFTLLDGLVAELDTALQVLAAPARATRPDPAAGAEDGPAHPDQRRESAALMRVNHAGEVCAQALYRGQALVARSAALRASLLDSAAEENDHLAWCEGRIGRLGGHVSRLNPLWYAGSFALGVLAGLAGDRISLGFLAETERQVTAHLDGHLERLPDDDLASRRIVARMRAEELAHGAAALARGGQPLPAPAARAMGLAARVMTTLAHRF